MLEIEFVAVLAPDAHMDRRLAFRLQAPRLCVIVGHGEASLASDGRRCPPPSSENLANFNSIHGKASEHLTMKITLIGHAAILVETRGVRILSDPWWQGPCFGAQWWPQRKPWLEPLSEAPPDFIYLSHGHGDHFHAGTMRRMPKTAKVLVSNSIGLEGPVADMGFDVIALAPKEVREIAPQLRVEVSPVIPERGGDTFLVIDDGNEICFNLNDALHAAPKFIQEQITNDLTRRYGAADYVFCGYGTASHFPNCFRIPGKDDYATAARRQGHFNAAWAAIVAKLQPRFAFPFAADVAILDHDLLWTNEPVHNVDRPTHRFRAMHPASPTNVFDIAPGFTIDTGTVTREILFEKVKADEISLVRADDILKANTVKPPTRSEVGGLADALRQHTRHCAAYLREFKGDYRFLIVLKATDTGIQIIKSGNSVDVFLTDEPTDRSTYDLVFTTRYSYLRRAVLTEYGHEIIFVGSGGLWEYRNRAIAETNLHRELAILLRKIDTPPRSRFGDQPAWLFHGKRLIKALLTKSSENDLYDLSAWTVFKI